MPYSSATVAVGSTTKKSDYDRLRENDRYLYNCFAGTRTVSSADYVILDNDDYAVIEVSTGAANRTITLPTRADNTGRTITIRKSDSGAGKVIVDGEGAETINGTTTWEITDQYGYVVVQANSTEWAVRTQEGSIYKVTDVTERSQVSPAVGTWYNLGGVSLTIPVAGIYRLRYEVQAARNFATAATSIDVYTTLSTTNNGETDVGFSTGAKVSLNTASLTILNSPRARERQRSVAAGVVYYLNTRTNYGGADGAIYNNNSLANALIEAERIG